MTERCAALNAAERKLDFWRNNKPKCPHCGHHFDVEANEAWGLYDEGDHPAECPLCDLPFTVTTHITHSFSTDRQPT